MLNWLKKEIDKDQAELNNEKTKFAEELKKLKKDELFIKPKETLWSKIKRILWTN